MMREVHRVFVAIDLDRFVDAVLFVCVVRIAARIDGPHVPFSFTVNDPFCGNLASAAPLRNPEGKHTRFIRVFHTRHGTNQWQPVRGIGNRSVDDATDAGRAKQWNARHGVFHIPFEAFEIIGV